MSLASATASASSSKGMTQATGPKISSRAGAVVVGDRRQHGRREPVAGAVGGAAADRHRGVVGDEGGDGLALAGGDQRPHLGRLVERVADPRSPRRAAPAPRGSRRRRRARPGSASARSSPGRRCRRPRHGAAAAAASRSASAKTTLADLPPSSSVTRLIVCAAPAAIPRPTSVEPVKAILATSGCSTRRWPQTLPGPATTLRTPSGSPASSAILSSSIAVSGVSSAGLRTTRVAGGERRRHLPGGDRQREVPGHDQADHAERLAEGHVDAAGDRDRLPEQPLRGAGVVAEGLDHHPDLAAGVADRLAGVARLQHRQLLGALLDRVGEPVQQRAPGRPARPRARPGTPPWPAPPRRRPPRPRRAAAPPSPARSPARSPRSTLIRSRCAAASTRAAITLLLAGPPRGARRRRGRSACSGSSIASTQVVLGRPAADPQALAEPVDALVVVGADDEALGPGRARRRASPAPAAPGARRRSRRRRGGPRCRASRAGAGRACRRGRRSAAASRGRSPAPACRAPAPAAPARSRSGRARARCPGLRVRLGAVARRGRRRRRRRGSARRPGRAAGRGRSTAASSGGSTSASPPARCTARHVGARRQRHLVAVPDAPGDPLDRRADADRGRAHAAPHSRSKPR